MQRLSLVSGPLAALLPLFFLSACADFYEPKPTSSTLQTGTVLTSTAVQAQTIVRDPETNLLTCSQGQPDATFDQSEGADLSFSLISLGGEDQGSETEETEASEMAGRTPAILMTRELFFRACEFSQNYKLNKDEALTLYNKTLDTIATVWATEAGNTTVTIGDTVSSTSTVGVSASNSDTITSSDTENNSTTASDSITTSQ